MTNFKSKINDYSNIDITNNPNIYKYSNFVIFRGSTSIIEAIQYGCVPIYYNNESELNVSPISLIFSKLFNVGNSDEFNKIFINFDKNKYNKKLSIIYNKVKYYYEPLKINKIKKIMND